MIDLQPCSTTDFTAYRDFVASDESVDRVARQETDRLLPDGPATKNQHLLSIKTESGISVGLIWLTVIERTNGAEAFILDFVVFPKFRRRGFARQAMPLVEKYTENLGLTQISLSVSAGNEQARALYASTGFNPVFVRMTKAMKKEPNQAPEPTAAAGRGSS